MLEPTGVTLRAGRVALTGEIASAEAVSDGFQRGTLRLDSGGDVRFVAVDLPPCAVGTTAHVSGYWEVHPEWGAQVRVMEMTTHRPTEEAAVVRYIIANVEGCGHARARRIVRTLGVECLDRLERDPDLAATLFPGALGLALAHAWRRWAAQSRRDTKAKALAVRLMAAGVKYGTVRRVTQAFTSAEAAEIAMLRHPYRLLDVPGVGWLTADRIARLLGIREDAPERLDAACRHALERAQAEGHTGLPDHVLARRAAKLLGRRSGDALMASAVARLEEDGILVRVDRLVASPEVSDTEWRIAEAVGRLVRHSQELSAQQCAVVVPVIARSNLSSAQQQAVWLALSHSAAVLTGRPGSGKTTVLATYLQCCDALGWSVQVVAPTGKAASRAASVTRKPAATVHRTLGGAPGCLPGKLAVQRIVVDEASMCDAETMAWLLAAVDPAKTAVLWTGDADQLPSVGCGAVLRDLIESGRVPVARLTEIFRQGAASEIVKNAHRLLDGQPLVLTSAGDWQFAEVRPSDAPGRARHILAALVNAMRASGADPRTELQVLAPMRRGPLGVESLNQMLQGLLNPSGAEGPMVGGGTRVRVGDRVVATRNMYELAQPLYNGEQGVISAVDRRGHSLSIRVDDTRTVMLRGVQCLMVRLAWAITVHRSQGSEYPHAVLLYDHRAHARMLDVGVLYTAITRAQNRFTLIGTRAAVEQTRQSAARHRRYTGLTTYLRGIL